MYYFFTKKLLHLQAESKPSYRWIYSEESLGTTEQNSG